MAMKIRPGAVDSVSYVSGRFVKDDAFAVNRIDGDSPFGNVLASLGSDYFLELKPDGSGRSWYHGRPITSADGSGKAWYIKDLLSNQVWSAFHGPVCEKTDEYEVSYQPGSVTSHIMHNKIACSITLAVSSESPCEVWLVKLRNCSATDRVLSFTSYARPRAGSALECKYLSKEKAIMMRRPLEALESERTGRSLEDLVFFQSCTLAPSRYEIDKNRFIGEDRTLSNPQFLDEMGRQEFEPVSDSPIAGMTIEIELPIEGEAEFGFCFGATREIESALEIIHKHAKVDEIKTSIETTRNRWAELSSTIKVETQDKEFDALVNTWLPYEACVEWIKEHSGAPHLDPYSAADALRCLAPFFATSPDLCRETLLNFVGRLSVMGGYAVDESSQMTLPNSELLWLAICTARYVAENGDESVLSKSVSLTDGPSLTLSEHCERAIRLMLYDKHSTPSQNELMLLEQALRLWSLICAEPDEFYSHIETVRKSRMSLREDYTEPHLMPKRGESLTSASPSLSGAEAWSAITDYVSLRTQSGKDSTIACLIYSAIIEYILGIEATNTGLILEPHLPESWSECSYTRKFRGDIYIISVKRSVDAGKTTLIIDNEPILGNMLPFFGDGKEHRVDVMVG